MSRGPIFTASGTSITWAASRRNHYIDMNGDGVAEVVYLNDDGSMKVGYGTIPNTSWAIPESGLNVSTPVNTSYYPRALVDMNGDSLPDWAVKSGSGVWHIYLNNGTKFEPIPQIWNDPSATGSGDYLLDTNGDGLPDLVSSSGGSYKTWVNTGNKFSSTPNNTTITASPYTLDLVKPVITVDLLLQGMFNTPALNFKEGGMIPALTPTLWKKNLLMISKINHQSGLKQQISYKLQTNIANASDLKLWTVNRTSTSGSVAAGYRSIKYTYAGGLYNTSTKEFRGFKTVTQTGEQTRISTVTDFYQDIIFQGRPFRIRTMLANSQQLISDTKTTWSSKQYDAGKRHFAYVSTSISDSYELDGSLVGQNRTDNTYDSSGNITQSISSTAGYSTTITNQFTPVNSCLVASTTKKLVMPPWAAQYAHLWWYYALVNLVGIWETVPTQALDSKCRIISKLSQSAVTKSSPSTAGSTRTSSFAYDSKGQLIEEVIEPTNPALSQTTRYGYDAFGNSTSTTASGSGITSRTTTVVYDANGMFPVSTTNALGHKESYTWDPRFGSKLSLTGPNALTTSWRYDGFGRKTVEIRADGTRTDIVYGMDIRGKWYYWKRWVYTRSSDGSVNMDWYDSYDRKRITAAPIFSGAWAYRYTAYNWKGQVLYQTLPYTNWWLHKQTSYSYDPVGRAIATTLPDGSITRITYNGLTTTATNAKSQTKTTVKNVLGQVVSITDALNGKMSYAYDVFGNLTQTTDAANNITTMGYDIRGRKTSMTDPDMGSWSYEYDVLGNLVKQTDAKKQVTTMVYDKLGRMTSRTEAEGISSWVYDSKWTGALSSESSPISSKSYSYDGFGRVTSSSSTINGQNYTVGTAYDAVGRINTLTYPTGLVVKRNYNASGYLKSISNNTTGAIIWQADTVDEFGRTTGESFGNGVSTTHTYDAVRGTLTSLKSTSAGAIIQDWSYNYDAMGNMLFRTDAVVGYTENFTYDNLNRLRTVSNTTGILQKSYAYDAIGNITNKSDVGTYTYDINHPHAVQTAGGNTYIYDANGNQTSGAGRTLAWTSFNKPSGIWTATAYTGFGYDANHNRITKTTPTSSTVYIGKIFEEITIGTLTKDRNHIYAGSKLVASIENNVGGLTNIRYIHGDHLGSISVITDELGAVVERLRFDVFGLPVDANTGTAKANIGSTNTTRGYTGHEMDASTGLINMNARLYDPVLGRFLSADTVVPGAGNMQSFNRYAYVLNNPLAYTDLTGHSWWTNFRDTVVKPVVIAVVAAIVVYATAGIGASWAVAAGATQGGAIAGIVGGAASGAAAGFVGGATGAALYGGNLNQMLDAGLKGAGAGAGAVAGYYGDAWSLSRVGATSVAGGFAAKSSGGSWNQGFKMAVAASMLRYGFDKVRADTNASSLEGKGLHVRDSSGLRTDGTRVTVGGTAANNNWFTNTGMNREGTPHIYDSILGGGYFINMVSKVHDFVNSWGYEAGNYVSGSKLYNTGFQAYSMGMMVPAAVYTTGALMDGLPSQSLLVRND